MTGNMNTKLLIPLAILLLEKIKQLQQGNYMKKLLIIALFLSTQVMADERSNHERRDYERLDERIESAIFKSEAKEYAKEEKEIQNTEVKINSVKQYTDIAITNLSNYTNQQINNVNNRVDHLSDKLSSGIASIAAMQSLPQTIAGKNYSVGLATGYFNNQQAVSSGIKANITENINATASIASGVTSGSNLSAGAGLGFSW